MMQLHAMRSQPPSMRDATVVARFARAQGDAVDTPVHWRGDHAVVGPFPSFHDAVDAAAALVGADRRDAAYGLFGRRHGLVLGAGVRNLGDGTYDVGRVSLPVDAYDNNYPGWNVRYDPAVAVQAIPGSGIDALVGATRMFDLRGGGAVGPTRWGVR